jgi:branched-chain amino acid transport system permease protein/neutral amino acid transport system permease protein
MDLLFAGTGFGIVVGAILTLAAVGFTLQYSVTNVFNLAFTETMIVSGFVAYWLNSQGVSMWWATLAAVGVGAGVSVLMNRLIYQPFIDKGTPLYGLVIVSLALSLILANTLLAVTGPLSFRYDVQPTTAFTVGGGVFTNLHVLIVGSALLAMAAVYVLLMKTKVGKAMRAASVDPTLAQSCGVPTRRLVNAAWGVSGALCGGAGVAFLLSTSTFSAMSGRTFIVLVIAAAVLGGIGDALGAMLGAMVIGLSTELGAIWLDPSYKTAIALLFLLAVLVWRPQGIRAEFARVRGATA